MLSTRRSRRYETLSIQDEELKHFDRQKQTSLHPNSFHRQMKIVAAFLFFFGTVLILMFQVSLTQTHHKVLQKEQLCHHQMINSWTPETAAKFSSCSVIQPAQYASAFRDQWISFIGESTARNTFRAVVDCIGNEIGSPPNLWDNSRKSKHAFQKIRLGSGIVSFEWMPYLEMIPASLGNRKGRIPTGIYINVGLHNILDRRSNLSDSISVLINSMSEIDAHLSSQTKIWIQLAPFLEDDKLKPHHMQVPHYRNKSVLEFHELFRAKWPTNLQHIVLLQPLKALLYSSEDGVHSKQRQMYAAQRLLELLQLHKVGNQWSSPLTKGQLFLAFILLLSIVDWLSALNPTRRQVHQAIWSLAAIVSIAEVIDGSHDYSIGSSKLKGSTYFCIACVAGTSLALWFLTPLSSFDTKGIIHRMLCLDVCHPVRNVDQRDPSKLWLNRNQTEEWKGWMQICFVFYHLFPTFQVYNIIRVFVGSYIWMTGYGNACYYLKTGDFTWQRFFKSVLRLNLLALLLSIVLERNFIQYYICGLHSFYYIYSLVLCWFLYTPDPHTTSPYHLPLRLVAGLLPLVLLFETRSSFLFNWIFSPLSPLLQEHGSLHEWHFRAQLDCYMAWFGVVCACLVRRYRTEWTQLLTNWYSFFSQISTMLFGSICIIVWIGIFLPFDRYTYNPMHRYVGCLPIIGYLVLRNQWSSLRRRYLPGLAYIGRITLETYLLQFHVYMTDSAKLRLSLTTGAAPPFVEIFQWLLFTITFVWMSGITFHSSSVVISYLVKDTKVEEKLTRPYRYLIGIALLVLLVDELLVLSLVTLFV